MACEYAISHKTSSKCPKSPDNWKCMFIHLDLIVMVICSLYSNLYTSGFPTVFYCAEVDHLKQ